MFYPAIIDTNVFISGLNFAGKPGEVLDLFVKGEIEVYVSPFILLELESILENRFGWGNEQTTIALDLIKAKAILVKPNFRLSIIKGKDADNRILECAIAGKVD